MTTNNIPPSVAHLLVEASVWTSDAIPTSAVHDAIPTLEAILRGSKTVADVWVQAGRQYAEWKREGRHGGAAVFDQVAHWAYHAL